MKITKKAIKEAPAFILGIDYKASYQPLTIELKSLTANNLLDALKEANNYWNDDTVWCLNIYNKTDIVDGELIKYEECIGTWRENRWETRDDKDINCYCYYCPRWKDPIW